MQTRNQKLSRKTFITLTAVLFIFGLSIVGLGREGFLSRVHLLPSAKAQEVARPEVVTQAQENAPTREREQVSYASLRSLKGRYTDYATASVLPDGLAPAACVGVVNFDGRGHMKMTESHSFNGLIIPEAHYDGTYTINDDFTGIMTIRSLEQGFIFKQKFVLNENTQEITYIVMEDGEVSTGTMKKMP